jgi:HK97 family phage major capsid protein
MSKALIKDLREKNSATLATARGLLAEIKDDTPSERAAELETQHDNAMSDYDKRNVQIERLQRMVDADAREAGNSDAETRARRPHPGAQDAPTGDDAAPQYRDVFRKVVQFGLSELTGEERSVFQGAQTGIEASEQRALASGTGAGGGYLIPQDMAPNIDKAMAIWGPMMDGENVANHIETATGNTITLPTLDYTAKRGDLKAEGAAALDDNSKDPAFGQKTLGAYLYTSGIVRVSLELLQDSNWNMEALLDELFGESLGRTCNDVLTLGDGSGKPNGILNFATNGKTAAAEAAIVSDELIDLFHSVNPAYRMSPKCLWQLNDGTLATVRKLKDGQGNYIWQEANIRSGEPGTLLGKPYRINPSLPDIAESATPIIFGDHSKYTVRKVAGAKMIRFGEKFMNELEIGLMAYRRIDGEGTNSAAIKKLTMKAAA